MSSYMDALKRLTREADRRSDFRGSADERPRVAPAPPPAPPARRAHVGPSGRVAAPAVCAAEPTGIDELHDRLRAVPRRDVARTVVLAGVESRQRARAVAEGVVRYGHARGTSGLVLTLRESTTGLFLVPDDDGRPPLALDGPDLGGALDAWLARHADPAGLVLVDGPPLARSSDAAVVGAACDGVLVVAETLVTDRVALGRAVERARRAGALVLGTVCVARDRTPRWLARLTAARPGADG